MHKKIVQDDQIYVSHYKNLNATNVNEAPFFFCSPLSNIYPPVLCLFLPVRSPSSLCLYNFVLCEK